MKKSVKSAIPKTKSKSKIYTTTTYPGLAKAITPFARIQQKSIIVAVQVSKHRITKNFMIDGLTAFEIKDAIADAKELYESLKQSQRLLDEPTGIRSRSGIRGLCLVNKYESTSLTWTVSLKTNESARHTFEVKCTPNNVLIMLDHAIENISMVTGVSTNVLHEKFRKEYIKERFSDLGIKLKKGRPSSLGIKGLTIQSKINLCQFYFVVQSNKRSKYYFFNPYFPQPDIDNFINNAPTQLGISPKEFNAEFNMAQTNVLIKEQLKKWKAFVKTDPNYRVKDTRLKKDAAELKKNALAKRR